MKVVKKINNNVAVCMDDNGRELIAFGKGIGFPAMPYELHNLKLVDRTFYGINSGYISLINEIPDDIINISVKIVDYGKARLQCNFNPNVVITLADHINFMLQRYEKKMHISMPLTYEIRSFYMKEIEVGQQAVKYIEKVKNIRLPRDEVVGIAMCFINSKDIDEAQEPQKDMSMLIDEIKIMVEEEFNVILNEDSFNYSRFLTHMTYLFKRSSESKAEKNDSIQLLDVMCEQYPDIYQVSLKIGDYLKKEAKFVLDKEEILYLMLHINRLIAREDCNQ